MIWKLSTLLVAFTLLAGTSMADIITQGLALTPGERTLTSLTLTSVGSEQDLVICVSGRMGLGI